MKRPLVALTAVVVLVACADGGKGITAPPTPAPGPEQTGGTPALTCAYIQFLRPIDMSKDLKGLSRQKDNPPNVGGPEKLVPDSVLVCS